MKFDRKHDGFPADCDGIPMKYAECLRSTADFWAISPRTQDSRLAGVAVAGNSYSFRSVRSSSHKCVL
jgi:hypothetical protein